MPSERWLTSVDELVQIFRAALIALVPIADRAHMSWREPSNYDDWDSISAAIYNSVVLQSLENSSERDKYDVVPPYDHRTECFSYNSFLTAKDDPGACAFICFETNSSPFDTCLFGRLNESSLVVSFERRETDSVSFVLAGWSGDAFTMVDALLILL